jgi:hypothetical protein
MTDAHITPGQDIGARQFLGWRQSDLAKMVRVSEKSFGLLNQGSYRSISILFAKFSKTPASSSSRLAAARA